MNEQKTLFFDTGELTSLAKQGLISEVRLFSHPPIGITRVEIDLSNGAKNCRVKLLNRKKDHAPVEKLFRSITGVHQWAYKLIYETSQAKEGHAIMVSCIHDHQQVTIDGISYNKSNPFVWEKHHKK
jgi:hypothetical protein